MNVQDLIGLNPLREAAKLKAPNIEAKSYLLGGCKTGVELEFEGCEISEMDMLVMTTAGWAGKPDGSLRQGGYEWIVRYPLADAALRDAVYFALDMARKRNYTVSVRTGLHTHVNVMDMTLEQYKTLLLIYAFIEPAIYHYAGNDRDENVHCLPWFNTSDGLSSISDVYNSSEESFRRSLENVERYGGLNLAATRRFGSLEWRHMKATLDPGKIMDWISINHRIKEAALRLTKEGRDLVADAGTNPQWALEQMLQNEIKFLWYNGIVADCSKIGLHSMLDIVHRGAPKYRNPADWENSTFTLGVSEAMQSFLNKPKKLEPEVPEPEAAQDFLRQVPFQIPRTAPRVPRGARVPVPEWRAFFDQNQDIAARVQEAREQAEAQARRAWINEGPPIVDGNLWNNVRVDAGVRDFAADVARGRQPHVVIVDDHIMHEDDFHDEDLPVEDDDLPIEDDPFPDEPEFQDEQ